MKKNHKDKKRIVIDDTSDEMSDEEFSQNIRNSYFIFRKD
jgi:hypothetical protein